MSRLTSAKVQIPAMGGLALFVIATFGGVYVSLKQYHVSPWIFLVINIITIPPYTYGIGRLIIAMMKREPYNAIIWALVAVAAFAAPYIYIAVAAQSLPAPLTYGLILFVSGLALLAIFRTHHRLHAARQERTK